MTERMTEQERALLIEARKSALVVQEFREGKDKAGRPLVMFRRGWQIVRLTLIDGWWRAVDVGTGKALCGVYDEWGGCFPLSMTQLIPYWIKEAEG